MGPGSYDMPIPSRAAAYVKNTISSKVRHYVQDVGLDYYWQLARGTSTPQQMQQLLSAKAATLREEQKVRKPATTKQAQYHAIFKDY